MSRLLQLRFSSTGSDKFEIRNLSDHVVGLNLSRKQPETNDADQEQRKPRTPKRRLVHYDVARDLSVEILNVSGGADKSAKQSGGDIFYQRAQTDDIAPARLED